MKVQFEGDILIGNNGAVVVRNWTIKADEGESQRDVVVGMKRIAIERLVMALESLRDDIRKLEGGGDDATALVNAFTSGTKH